MARFDVTDSKLEERVVRVNRVAKVVKGGRRFSFSAMVVVGDGNGVVGAGLGKAGEVPEAIRKGVEQAKKNLIRVPMSGTTIPHQVDTHFGASKVMLKPAAPGTGVIAGGSVRAIVEAAGIRDILSKNHGSKNPINVVKATLRGLSELREASEQAAGRGMSVDQMLGRRSMSEQTEVVSHLDIVASVPAEVRADEEANDSALPQEPNDNG